MTPTLRYPIGLQYFPDLIEGGYVYADKTKYIRMLEKSGKYFFLSRPRRFGKSLFLSTLASYFEGRRELFKGLDIDRDDTEWTTRPVISLSLNTVDANSENALMQYFDDIFTTYEKIYGKIPEIKSLSKRFELILKNAYEKSGQKVAVLIDEYDAPILNTLEDEHLNKSFRETLKSILSVLKNGDEYIHFAFITGVSRFSHTSLFSGANNLNDISLRDDYASICGITEDELTTLLAAGIHDFAKKMEVSDEKMVAILKENYDGYHFSKRCRDIYNPFSILNALDAKEIANYWFNSGTSSFLLKMLKRDNFYLPDLDCTESLESDLSAKESYLQNPTALLYEAGYITIKEYDEEIESYILGLPNKEVATSFSEALLPIYSDNDVKDCRDSFVKMRKAILKGEPDNFMHRLQTFLQGNPYSNTEMAKRESYFKNNIYLIFKALGFMPRNEEETCRSRMDVMLRTRRFIYIFELKTDGSVEKGLEQINEKEYALPYRDEGRKIFKISANYSSACNNIDAWKIKE